MRQKNWSAFITSCGPVSDHPSLRPAIVDEILIATGRLEPAAKFNPLFTHRVRITTAADLDNELHGWLATAYALAG